MVKVFYWPFIKGCETFRWLCWGMFQATIIMEAPSTLPVTPAAIVVLNCMDTGGVYFERLSRIYYNIKSSVYKCDGISTLSYHHEKVHEGCQKGLDKRLSKRQAESGLISIDILPSRWRSSCCCIPAIVGKSS